MTSERQIYVSLVCSLHQSVDDRVAYSWLNVRHLIWSSWSHVNMSHIQVAWFGELAGGAEEEKLAPRPPL